MLGIPTHCTPSQSHPQTTLHFPPTDANALQFSATRVFNARLHTSSPDAPYCSGIYWVARVKCTCDSVVEVVTVVAVVVMGSYIGGRWGAIWEGDWWGAIWEGEPDR